MNEITNKNNDLERVDFDDTTSILNYGASVYEEMGSFMKSFSSMTSVEPVEKIDFDKVLEKIDSFSNYLKTEENDDENVKGLLPQLQKSITNGVKNIKTKLGIEVYNESFADQFAKVNEEVDAIQQSVEKRKETVFETMKIDRAYIENMKIYTEKVSRLIEIGVEDLNIYKEKTMILEENITDEFDRGELESNKQRIALFEQKLDSLKRDLIQAKTSILQTKVKENSNGHFYLSLDECSKSAVNMLRIQTTSIITTKMQRDNLAEQQRLNDITNKVIKNNSEAIISNIEKVNELRVSGNIYMDTLKELYDNIIKCKEIIEEGNALEQAEREKNDPVLLNMIDELNKQSVEFSSVVSGLELPKPKVK